MPFLRQSTTQTIRFGPCLDKTDGVSEETGLTLAQADMRLSKDGGAFAQKSAAGNATHDSDGWYSTALSTTDTDTVGELILNVHQPANMLPVWLRWWVLEEEVYDDLFGASAVGYLKPVTAGRDLDVTATGAAGIDWGNIENPTTVVDLAGTDINLVDTVTTNTDVRGTDNAALATVCTEARLAELAAANLPTDIGDVQDRLPAALVGGRIDADVGAISTSTDAADKLEASAETIEIGAAEAGTLSTTQMTTDLSEATDDHYNGRVIIWTSGVLLRQATDITGYTGANGLLTFTAVTEAPSAADTFVMV